MWYHYLLVVHLREYLHHICRVSVALNAVLAVHLCCQIAAACRRKPFLQVACMEPPYHLKGAHIGAHLQLSLGRVPEADKLSMSDEVYTNVRSVEAHGRVLRTDGVSYSRRQRPSQL